MRLAMTSLALCLALTTSAAHADKGGSADMDADAPDFRTQDVALAYEVNAEAYSAFSLHFNRARAYFVVGDFTNSIKELERAYLLVRDPTAP